MVHRVLTAVLNLDSIEKDESVKSKHMDGLNAELLDKQCAECNEIRLSAKYASEACAVVSSSSFAALYMDAS